MTRTSFGGGVRHSLRAFVAGGRAYVGLGFSLAALYNDPWEYHPATDTWTAQAPMPVPIRTRPATFVVGNQGYEMSGRNFGAAFNDVWQFIPPGTMGVEETEQPAASPDLWPIPTAGPLHVRAAHAATAHLYDAQCHLVRTLALSAGETTADLAALPAGIYLLRCGAAARRVLVQR